MRGLFRVRDLRRRAARDEDGAVLVEFAIALPILLLIMAAFVDFGSIVFQKLRLDETVSATANYAIMNADRLEDPGPQAFAADLGNLLAAGGVNPPAAFRVNINDSFEFRLDSGTARETTLGGAPGNCYCPQRSAAGFTFGNAQICGNPCADGSRAGRFIVIEARKPYSPLFTSYGLSDGDVIRTMSILPILQ